MKYRRILIFIFFIGLSSSCRKLFIAPDDANTRSANFELLWKILDEKYSYFTYKKIDWKAMHDIYKVQALKAKNEEELFNVMGAMLDELKDGHVNLVSYFNISRNWNWYLNYPPNFNYNIIERNYLKINYEIAGPSETAVINNVGYIYYGSFEKGFSPATLDYLITKYSNLKGIIIDIRDNGGGSLGYSDAIVSHFLKENTFVAYTKYKSGPGHDDFTDFYPTTLGPSGQVYKGKVVVLTNRKVYSAANYFTGCMAQLPNVTIIGDQTGGGGGAPITSELQIGWRVRFSATQLFDSKKNHLEDGIVPDIKVDINPSDEANGKDTILETALNFLQ